MRKSSLCALLLALAALLGCTKQAPEQEGYRVISYDGTTHQWTILRSGMFDGKYLRKRLVVVCDSYKWGRHESVKGPEACHLQVGRLIVPDQTPDDPKAFVDVFEMPSETLAITEGYGDDRVSQQFTIIKYEVLPDEGK
jgi:hypothetical protein